MLLHESEEIWAHELCLLWANIVIVDHKVSKVDVKTILPAVQNAKEYLCRYCGLTGASSKCNHLQCDIYYHYYCIKKSKIRGLQFDVNEK